MDEFRKELVLIIVISFLFANIVACVLSLITIFIEPKNIFLVYILGLLFSWVFFVIRYMRLNIPIWKRHYRGRK